MRRNPRFRWLFLTMIIGNVSAQEMILPHQLTEQEKILLPQYQPPTFPREFTDPPPYLVRAMAEWEELQGILITWTSFYSILTQIVDHAQEECLVFIVCSDSNSVKTYLTNQGVPRYNLRFLQTSFNSIWIRDYGPWSAYTVTGDTLNIIDWIYNRPRPADDIIPQTFASWIQAPFYSTNTTPNNLTHAGGNFMVDGEGNAFSSNLILEENPSKTEAEIDTIMKRFMGISRFVKMAVLPYDVIHHIDMHMKLLDEETLLVGEYPPGVSDGPQIEANLDYILNNFQTCYGRPYKVIRVPMPPDQSGRYPSAGGDYRTYTNGIIINRTVIIPTYELRYDTTALRIYRQAMPGYNIVGINCNSIIPLKGAIHCIVKEVGIRNPVHISHAVPETFAYTSSGYPLAARITHNSGIAAAELYWSTDTAQGYTAVPMTATAHDSFTCLLPPQAGGAIVFYYISARTTSGKTITKPLTAPAGNYRFMVEPATSLISDTSPVTSGFSLFQNYPNPFNPRTVIRWHLAGDSPVNLIVYNLAGQKVALLVSEKQIAGTHSVEFDGTNLASGVYFYRLEAGGRAMIRKMVLMQ